MKKKTLEEAAYRLYPILITDAYNSSEETLEEAAITHAVEVDKNIGSIIKDTYQNCSRLDFIAGAKYMAKRMYSKEDMEEAFTNGLNRSFDSDFDRWFEQFKKK